MVFFEDLKSGDFLVALMPIAYDIELPEEYLLQLREFLDNDDTAFQRMMEMARDLFQDEIKTEKIRHELLRIELGQSKEEYHHNLEEANHYAIASAAVIGHLDVVKYLIDQGSNIETRREKVIDKPGRKALARQKQLPSKSYQKSKHQR